MGAGAATGFLGIGFGATFLTAGFLATTGLGAGVVFYCFSALAAAKACLLSSSKLMLSASLAAAYSTSVLTTSAA